MFLKVQSCRKVNIKKFIEFLCNYVKQLCALNLILNEKVTNAEQFVM